MRRKDLIFIAIIVAVLGIFIFLSVIGRKAPAMTTRAEHAEVNRKTPNDTCLACHAPDSTVAPMPARHPKKGKPPDTKTSCFACHRPTEDHVASLSLWTLTEHTLPGAVAAGLSTVCATPIAVASPWRNGTVPGAPSVLRAVATRSILTR